MVDNRMRMASSFYCSHVSLGKITVAWRSDCHVNVFAVYVHMRLVADSVEYLYLYTYLNNRLFTTRTYL